MESDQNATDGPKIASLSGEEMGPELVKKHERALELTRDADIESNMALAFWALYRIAQERGNDPEVECYVLANMFREQKETNGE